MTARTLCVSVERHPGDRTEEDAVAVEEPLEIRVEGRALVVTMRTPGDDVELVTGFLYSEGVIDDLDDLLTVAKVRNPLDPQDNTIDVRLAPGISVDDGRFASAQRTLFASSACGVCGKATIEQVMKSLEPISPCERINGDWLLELPAKMRKVQSAFDETGGLHAAALFDLQTGALEVLREDVGRHNAVDKVLGWRFREDRVPVDDVLLLVSGRAGFEIIQKALSAGVPALAAVGAPSSLAVQLAEEAGLQLFGFVREGRFNRYC
jgi:FdhD protein